MIRLNMPRIPPPIVLLHVINSDLNVLSSWFEFNYLKIPIQQRRKQLPLGRRYMNMIFFLLVIGNGEATKMENTNYYLLVYTHSVIVLIRQSSWFTISDYDVLV